MQNADVRVDTSDFNQSPIEDCCEEPQPILNNSGSIVCKNCGMVYGELLVSNEKRAYTAEEVKKRKRTEPTYKKYGARTVFKKLYRDAKGRSLGPKKKKLFYRLSKINRSLVTSLERNFMEAMPKMLFISKKLNLPNYVFETAWKIYALAAKKKLTMGRSIEDFVCASLYAAIRIHELPRILDDVKEIAMVSGRSIHRALGLVVRKILPELGLKYAPIGSKELIYRFGNELNMHIKTQEKAQKILRYAKGSGLRSIGKDPKGLAGASLYIAGRLDMDKRTQKDISKVAKVTEVTLRNRIKQIKKFIKRE